MLEVGQIYCHHELPQTWKIIGLENGRVTSSYHNTDNDINGKTVLSYPHDPQTVKTRWPLAYCRITHTVVSFESGVEDGTFVFVQNGK